LLIALVLFAFVALAVQSIRAAADKVSCTSNLKQIGLAINEFHSVYGQYPLPYVEAQSWTARILPFLDGTEVVDDLLNIGLVVPAYRCLANGDCSTRWADSWGGVHELAFSSYCGVLGCAPPPADGWADGVFGGHLHLGVYSPVKSTHVTDGLSNTVMVGERPPDPSLLIGIWNGGEWHGTMYAVGDGPLPNLYSGDGDGSVQCPDKSYFSAPVGNWCDSNHYWSRHAGGGNWLLADGSVRFMTWSAGTSTIPSMATIDGGEILPAD